MRHLIEPTDFNDDETMAVLDLADRIAAAPEMYAHVADGKKLATLFYEPSTRTRLSFESAMLSLGGQTLGFSGAEQSSATKGETVADTARVVSCYSNIIAMRHPKEGAPLRASMFSKVPVINAGDGGHNHPTQTLIDLLTIRQRMGRLDHLTVGFCGDLKFGRTVHSLVNNLVRFLGNQFYFISPEELRIPEYLKEDTLHPANSLYWEVSSLEDTLPKLDVLYMTRVQKERFFNEEDYIRLKSIYTLDPEKMKLARPDMPVLHPLPRVDEITRTVDDDPRAAYFDQVQNGVYVRMALIMALLGIADPVTGEGVKMLKVEPIQNGVVIDHIPAGRGMEIYRLLHLESKHQAVALLQSVRSEKYGTKDLIKIEGSNLPERLGILGYLDRRITLIYIKDGVVERKCQPDMPEILRNVVKCTNPRCITSIEAGCDHIFKLSPSGKYRCLYCNQELPVQR